MIAKAEDQGKILIKLARSSIAHKLDVTTELPDMQGDWLMRPGASFVTLQLSGDLRGCIGSLEAWRPLIEDVQANALAAAFKDPRFSPLTHEEFSQVKLEVSLLTPLEAMHARNENIALSKLRKGIDGVVLKYGSHKATFLPQVWSQLPESADFMRQLKRKAGLAADFWHPEILLYKYQVQKYQEHGQVVD